MEHEKKTRNIIIITILFFLVIALVSGIIRYYPTIKRLLKNQKIAWKEYHNHHIHFFYALPEQSPTALMVIIPDQRMNRFWNANHIETDMGLELSGFFIKNNIIPILYDRSDAYSSSHLFSKREPIIQQLIQYLKEIYHFKKQKFKKQKLYIFSHGDGCLITLKAMKHISFSIDKVFLVNCGFQNSLLNYFGDLIFYTMQRTSVENDIIQKAKQEWKQWYHKQNYTILTEKEWQNKQEKMVKEGVHPDLIAFRKTMYRFQFKENYPFIREAKNLNFFSSLNFILKNSSTQVVHFLSEYDEEIPPKHKNFIKKQSKKLKRFSYQLFMIPQTDHFLFFQKRPANTPMEIMLNRNNPFNEISPHFLKILKQTL